MESAMNHPQSRLWPLFCVYAATLAFLSLWTSHGDMAVLVLIAVFGIPHGALDVLMMICLSKNLNGSDGVNGRVRLGLYALAYLVAVIFCLFLWMKVPTMCLVLLLILAAGHFGEDWTPMARKSRVFLGVVVVTLPSIFHPNALNSYFVVLGVDEYQASNVVTMMNLACFLSCIVLITQFIKHSMELSLWVISLFIAAALLPVLQYFCLYFCALHAPLHTLDVKQSNRLSWNQVFKAALLPTIGAALIMIAFFYWLPDKGLSAQLLNTVFITLFALTVPHLFLTRVYNGRVRTPEMIEPNK